MTRRELVAALGAAAAWPFAARGQQPRRMRRIGAFLGSPSDNPSAQIDTAVLLQGLQDLGWTVGRNLQIDWRWYRADAAETRKDAEDLVALAPDVIAAYSGPVLAAMVGTHSNVPIVFASVVDPVGAGYVTNLARPGGNVTGFALEDFSTSVKWLQLLKEIAPAITRILVLRTVGIGGASQFGAIQAVAPAMGVELRPVDPSNRDEIERTVGEIAREPTGGLIVTTSAPAVVNRELIIASVAKYRLPAVYSSRFYVEGGGLISFGAVRREATRPVAGYVDRILRGEKAGDLPVQAPTKYELVLNTKTAKAQGFTIPPTVLARADEVIE